MNASPRGLRARHGIWLVAFVAALALASACASPFHAKGPTSGSHACADKLAQATVTSVPGLGDCFDATMKAAVPDPAVLKPFARSWRYLGQSADEDSANGSVLYLYEITYPQPSNGMTGQVLGVWEDSHGLISGAGIIQRVV